MQIQALYQLFLQHPQIQTDTRLLKPGDIFFALKGNLFNGNTYAKTAIEKGAAFAIIDEPEYEIFDKTILVPDVLLTLQQLAGFHRLQFNIPFIAITGSNGKTTTKELIHSVLSQKLITYTTSGNLNNHIGIPLTLLNIKKDAEIAVIEMGANHQYEIESYCQYTKPTHGLITNCGKAHLEGFGSEEGVRIAKGELFNYLRYNNGFVFLMNDYIYLQELSKGIPNKFSYGTTNADIEGSVFNNEPFLTVAINKPFVNNIHSNLVGAYNLSNILAAVAVGKFFGVSEFQIKNAIENYTPGNNRSQWLPIGSNHLILDAYNANPSSVKAAIENFSFLKVKSKILILGSMAELGIKSEEEHDKIIDIINLTTWDTVILVGPGFKKYFSQFLWFESANDAGQWIQKKQLNHTYILIKGSRSMKMESMLPYFINKNDGSKTN